MTFRAGSHFKYFYPIHNSYSCIPLQKTFTDSLYYIAAVSVLKYYPPKKGRGKVYSHYGGHQIQETLWPGSDT